MSCYNVHVIQATTAPTVAPTDVGQHWTNTTTGEIWFSNGTTNVGNWVLLQADTDVKVKVSAADTTAGYLNDELTVSEGTNSSSIIEKNITSPGSDEKLNIQIDQTKIEVTSTQITNFSEAVEDVIGAALVDSSTINFTYNDAVDSLTAVVDQTGLDYDVPVDVGTANAEGASNQLARADHVHEGVHGLKVNGGTLRHGDINLVESTGIDIVDDGSGNFSISASVVSLSEGIGVSFEDFVQGTLDGSVTEPYGFDEITSNGGSVNFTDTAVGNDFLGQASAQTGTTNNSTGFASMAGFTNSGKFRIGGLRTVFESRVRLPTLSGSPSYEVISGIAGSHTTILPANGVFFYYTHSTNSGQWRAVCRNSSSSTNLESTVAIVANQWFKLRIDINAAGTSVEFFIDDVSIGSITTNIPTTTSMIPTAGIEKTSSSTTSREIEVDYFYWKVFR